MLIFLWAIVSIIVAVSVDILSFSIKRTGWQRFISSFLLFYSQIIATEFILGLVHGLTGSYLVLFNLIISGGILFFVQRKHGKEIFRKYWATLNEGVRRLRKDILKDKLWLVLLIISGLLLAWIVFIGIIFPAIDFDGNSYHLPFVGFAIQNHTFFDVPTSIGWLAGYPKGGEFIELWNVIIANNDMFVDLVQVPFLFLGIGAIYKLSTRVGVDKKHARFTALLFLFLPIVLNQLKTTYIDVMLCALLFAGLAQVVQKKLDRLDLVLIGIIFSLIISLKDTGFFFVLALAVLLIWNLYKNRKKAKSFFRNYVRPLIAVFLPMLFGLYWYVKNYVLYGNPLYPFGLKIGNLTIFSGKTFQDLADTAINTLTVLPANCVDRVWFVWTEQKDWYGCLYNYDANFTGLGPIWFAILIPAFLVSIYFIVKKRNYLYAAISVLILAVFAVYPLNYYSRYTMFITILGFISLGIIFTFLRRGVTNVTKAVVIILAVVVFATNIALCNYTPGSIKAQIKSIESGDMQGPLYAGTLGQTFVYLQHKIQPGETVAYDSSPYFIYPLWRPDFSNKVTYVPSPTEQSWLDGLHAQHVRYVFTTINSKENKWLKADEDVKSIDKDSMYEIYQLY